MVNRREGTMRAEVFLNVIFITTTVNYVLSRFKANLCDDKREVSRKTVKTLFYPQKLTNKDEFGA